MRLLPTQSSKCIAFLYGCLAATAAHAHVPSGVLEVVFFGFGALFVLSLFVIAFLLTWRPSCEINRIQLFAEFCVVAFLTACALTYLPMSLRTDYSFLLPLIAIPVPLGAFVIRCRHQVHKGATHA